MHIYADKTYTHIELVSTPLNNPSLKREGKARPPEEGQQYITGLPTDSETSGPRYVPSCNIPSHLTPECSETLHY